MPVWAGSPTPTPTPSRPASRLKKKKNATLKFTDNDCNLTAKKLMPLNRNNITSIIYDYIYIHSHMYEYIWKVFAFGMSSINTRVQCASISTLTVSWTPAKPPQTCGNYVLTGQSIAWQTWQAAGSRHLLHNLLPCRLPRQRHARKVATTRCKVEQWNKSHTSVWKPTVPAPC